ncbi:type II toxin-antitoxin system PemK/MazF family toxin [uncultured Vagococcus sp.]|uniref:type II toxin-antitoxin system PemK/MazF family toxin n=1 Tax=uncultured Vagococcus sp. TaxID=189676 RepID=UPI0028D1A4D6|nr:type II toxin-antitoxin system PemK/MazF family toxin [uncultured Vagococcus sp.]
MNKKVNEVVQGGIYIANFGDRTGNVKAGIRPVLIVSTNKNNAYSNVVLVAPITTLKEKHKKKSYYSDIVLEKTERNKLKAVSVVQCGEIQTLDKESVLYKIGSLDEFKKEEVNKALLSSPSG